MKALSYGIGLAFLLGLAACQGKTSVHMTGIDGIAANSPGAPGTQEGTDGGVVPPGTPPPSHCDVGRAYTGYGAIDLTADRLDESMGLDRDRVKPFSALTGEYPRALGNTPPVLAQMASTFGSPPDRWYAEPRSNAISLYGAYRIAFQGCLTVTATDAQYAAAPDGNSAPKLCAQWEQTYWNRTPNNDEVAACSEFAVTGTTTETDPRRQWAYACATVLSSAQFLGY